MIKSCDHTIFFQLHCALPRDFVLCHHTSVRFVPFDPLHTAAGHGITASELSMIYITVIPSCSIFDSQPSDIAQTPAFPLICLVNTFGNTSKSFSPLWYDEFEWLENSINYDVYPYCMFGFACFNMIKDHSG